MSNPNRKVHGTITITAEELVESRERAKALALFPGEIAGLAAICRQIAAEHPEAAGDLDKVVTALEIGSRFAHECSERLWAIFATAELHDSVGRAKQ